MSDERKFLGMTGVEKLIEKIQESDKQTLVDAKSQGNITITTSETTEGTAKSYAIYQGEEKVGVIDIPKDMVISSGEVVVNPEGQDAGTYIKFVLANTTNDVIYVNVGTLVDIYKAQSNATQIQITVDSATREISASIVAGSVTDIELANDAVTTQKIANGSVAKEKLSADVQQLLEGIEQDVEDLKSAAYVEITADEIDAMFAEE